MDAAELTGRARTHVVDIAELTCAVHKHALAPFLNMRRAALREGIDLSIASGFRDFDRQLALWNEKWSGVRALYDAAGQPLAAKSLAPPARVEAILLWSALPGASRHHWGTDLDLIDRVPVAAGHRLRLTPDEYDVGGPFEPLAAWLDRHAARFGFFRPFRGVLSGVQAEPWHYSFAPVAESARRSLTQALLGEAIAAAPMMGKDVVLERLDDWHARFVRSVDLP